jgi:uncharacterized protein
MKETRNIIGWLSLAEEHAIMRQFSLHIEEIRKTTAFLADAMRAYINNDLNAKTLAIENVKTSERVADQIRLRISHDLYEGMVLPVDRETLLKFTKNLDKIADGTNASARLLGFIEHRLPDEILKNLSISTDLVVKGTAKLSEAIQKMGRNDMAEALRYCDEVDRLEHDADDQKRILIESIIRAKLDATSVLLTFNLAEALESVTDRMASVAEMVTLLAIRSK